MATGTFAYRAADPAGRYRRGRIEAADTGAAARELQRLGLLPVELCPARARSGTGASLPVPAIARRRGVLEVTRALAALLPAGMPVARALGAARQATSGPIAATLDDVRVRIERGVSLAAALREHPGSFSPFYAGVIDAGERAGDLAGAFDRLARHLGRRATALRARRHAPLHRRSARGRGGRTDSRARPRRRITPPPGRQPVPAAPGPARGGGLVALALLQTVYGINAGTFR